MDTTAYLQRINYNGSLALNAETLRQLQVTHLLSVPFENLSIHWKEPIVLFCWMSGRSSWRVNVHTA